MGKNPWYLLFPSVCHIFWRGRSHTVVLYGHWTPRRVRKSLWGGAAAGFRQIAEVQKVAILPFCSVFGPTRTEGKHPPTSPSPHIRLPKFPSWTVSSGVVYFLALCIVDIGPYVRVKLAHLIFALLRKVDTKEITHSFLSSVNSIVAIIRCWKIRAWK